MIRQRERQALRLNRVVARSLTERHRSESLDLIYERYSLWSVAAARFARREAVPFVLEVNSPLAQEQAGYRSLAMKQALPW